MDWRGELTATAGTLTNLGDITVDTSNGGSAAFTGSLDNLGVFTVQNSGGNVGTFNGGTIENPAGSVINVDGINGSAERARRS